MTSQLGKQAIIIHRLSNISKGKDNLKFDQLINAIRETFFLKNHTKKVVEKLFLDPCSLLTLFCCKFLVFAIAVII